MVTLFAWCCPAYTSSSTVDHTWVTTYDNRATRHPDVHAVVSAGDDFWFSWGVFHDKGGTPKHADGLLGSASGSRPLAQCLAKPNIDCTADTKARGTIFTYGWDGVCHQLTNQILYAVTAIPRLTVVAARGYMASSYIYGTYGRQGASWAAQVSACSGPAPMASGSSGTGGAVARLQDDFEMRARTVLGRDDPALFERLMGLRAESQARLSRPMTADGLPDAAALNKRNQMLLDEAAKLLGPRRFEEVFGFPADQRVDLVDPAIARGAQDR